MDRSFYMLTGSGLFLCRNHDFFRSCVPARRWPADLAIQSRSLTLRYPPIPRGEVERIVGFFARVAELHGSEAAVLLVWDSVAERMTTLVPKQSAGISESWTGHRYPIDEGFDGGTKSRRRTHRPVRRGRRTAVLAEIRPAINTPHNRGQRRDK